MIRKNIFYLSRLAYGCGIKDSSVERCSHGMAVELKSYLRGRHEEHLLEQMGKTGELGATPLCGWKEWVICYWILIVFQFCLGRKVVGLTIPKERENVMKISKQVSRESWEKWYLQCRSSYQTNVWANKQHQKQTNNTKQKFFLIDICSEMKENVRTAGECQDSVSIFSGHM